MDDMVDEYRNKGIKFKGNYIFVYNRKEKECMVRGKIFDPNKIIITGSLRMDSLISKSRQNNFNKSNNALTLFSFRHAFGGMRFREDDFGGFSISKNNGCVEFFDNVHGDIAIFAINNPSIPVYIKLKWELNWIDYVSDSIFKKTGKYIDDIPNLYIGSDFNIQELIDKSRVIVGINSTVLIEARILAKPVIIPIFDELEKKYYKNVYFKKYFQSEFSVIREKGNFLEKLTKIYKNTDSLKPVGSDIVEEFLGFFDCNTLNRVINEMINILRL